MNSKNITENNTYILKLKKQVENINVEKIEGKYQVKLLHNHVAQNTTDMCSHCKA